MYIILSFALVFFFPRGNPPACRYYQKTVILSNLKNWRPNPQINADAKSFTRLLNGRLITCALKLISPFQTGFIRGRFIADNGPLMKLVMSHATVL
jgi:hypothetical protein